MADEYPPLPTISILPFQPSSGSQSSKPTREPATAATTPCTRQKPGRSGISAPLGGANEPAGRVSAVMIVVSATSSFDSASHDAARHGDADSSTPNAAVARPMRARRTSNLVSPDKIAIMINLPFLLLFSLCCYRTSRRSPLVVSGANLQVHQARTQGLAVCVEPQRARDAAAARACQH